MDSKIYRVDYRSKEPIVHAGQFDMFTGQFICEQILYSNFRWIQCNNKWNTLHTMNDACVWYEVA